MCEINDRNKLARELADLRDSYDTLAKEAAESQVYLAAQVAALELERGLTVDEVAESLYSAKDLAVDIWADRIFHDGYLSGLLEAERVAVNARLDAGRKGFRNQNA